MSSKLIGPQSSFLRIIYAIEFGKTLTNNGTKRERRRKIQRKIEVFIYNIIDRLN
jgi:hypothetical protein